MFARGLMLRDFEDHHLHRRAMQYAFRRQALAGYMAQVDELGAQHVAAAVGAAGPQGTDVYQLTKRLTLDIAARVFVGLELGARADLVNDCFVAMMQASVAPVRRALPGTSFARGLRPAGCAHGHACGACSPGCSSSAGQPGLRGRTCSASCPGPRRSRATLATDEVVDHMILLLLAAHDTTTATLTVMLWQLSQQPHWQERLAQEVADLDGAPVTLENHKSLTDTELVMKEALRLSPPVPFSPRGVLRDTEVAGVPLRAGQMITLASLGLHRHPQWWSAPDEFDPLRFGPDRAEDRAHSHLYVPFGGGAHICLGNHLAELMTKAVLACVLAEHRVRARPGQRMEMAAVPIPRPRGRLLLTLA